MYKVRCVAALLSLTLCILPLNRTAAQQLDVSIVVYEAGRNKIGLLRYCRNNTSLDAAIAEKAAEVIETNLRTFPLENGHVRELGDRAEEAGEDGFLDAVRGRDIDSFAQRFRTTRAGLCQEWAEATLRAGESPPSSYFVFPATVQPTGAHRTIASPAFHTVQSSAIRQAAALPPVPTKAPFRLTKAKSVSPQLTLAVAVRPGNTSPSSPNVVPKAAPLSTEGVKRPPPVREAAACRTAADGRCPLLYSLGAKWRNLFQKP